MKVVLIFGLCIISINSLDDAFVATLKAKLVEVGGMCQDETGASNEDLAALLVHKIPEHREGKCMLFCFHKYFKLQNEDGSFNMDGAIDTLQIVKENDEDFYDKLIIILKNCLKTIKIEEDHCETALKFAVCAHNHAKEIGLDIPIFD